jgi:hypothetical protein
MLREIWGKEPEQIFTVTMAQKRATTTPKEHGKLISRSYMIDRIDMINTSTSIILDSATIDRIGGTISTSRYAYTIDAVVRTTRRIFLDVTVLGACKGIKCETREVSKKIRQEISKTYVKKDVKMLKLPSKAEVIRRSWAMPHRKLGYDLPGRIKSIRTTLATAKIETEKTITKTEKITTETVETETICRKVALDTKPNRIITLIDTSASTFRTILPKVAVEETLAIAYMLGINKIEIIEWDTGITYKTSIDKSLNLGDILIIKIVGYGGTVIDPALAYAIKIAQKEDLVLVFTDGGIHLTTFTHALAKELREKVCDTYIIVPPGADHIRLKRYFDMWELIFY